MHPTLPITVRFPLFPKRFQRFRKKEYLPFADIQLSSQQRDAAGLGNNFLTITLRSPRELAVRGELTPGNRGEAPRLAVQMISPELTLPRQLDTDGLDAVAVIRLQEPLDLVARGGMIVVALETVLDREPQAA